LLKKANVRDATITGGVREDRIRNGFSGAGYPLSEPGLFHRYPPGERRLPFRTGCDSESLCRPRQDGRELITRGDDRGLAAPAHLFPRQENDADRAAPAGPRTA